MAPRRIASIVLPKLACEIAKSRAEVKGPLAILLDPTQSLPRGQVALPGFEQPAQRSPFAKENAIIGAVCDEARRYGVRPGQKVAEATALVARLHILTVTFAEIDRALGRLRRRPPHRGRRQEHRGARAAPRARAPAPAGQGRFPPPRRRAHRR